MSEFEFVPTKREEPSWDFRHPEDVIIEVLVDDCFINGWSIEGYDVIPNGDVMGAASYEAAYVGFLDYTIHGLIDRPEKDGFYVVEKVTGVYHKGDGWMTDDDMEFFYENVREATQEEIDRSFD